MPNVRKNRRSLLLATTALLAGLSSYASLARADETGIETVTVTAQKRVEDIRTVPASIVAISAEQLATRGITNTLDLQHATTGITFGTSGSFSNFYMRGLGNAFSTPGAQSPVAFYLDGVYIADISSTAFGLTDIDHIEILKGPQGTLYGRNAVGGAINIITKKPSEDFELKLQAGGGNYANQEYTGYINGGNDVVQANLSLDRHLRNGYYKNLIPGGHDLNSVDTTTVHGKVRFAPSDGVEFILAADYIKDKGYGYAGGNTFGYPETLGPPTMVLNPGQFAGGLITSVPWKTTMTSNLANDVDNGGISLTGRFDLGAVNLVSITAFRDFKNKHGLPDDGTSANIASIRLNDFHQNFSQELQLLSNTDGPFSWIVGFYYLHDIAGFNPLAFTQTFPLPFPPPLVATITSKVKSDSYAGFGEGTYKFTDELSLIVGARYSVDQTTHYVSTESFNPVIAKELNSSGANKTWSNLSPRVSLKYQRPEGLYYVTWSKGYKAGLFNLSNIVTDKSLDVPVNPEKVNAWEAGAKWNFFDNTLQLNLAGFWYEDKDMQIQSLVASGETTFQNAGGRIRGVDLDGEWLVVPSLTLRAGVEFLDARYTSFTQASVYVPHSTLFGETQQGVACAEDATGASFLDAACLVSRDLSGHQLMRSPSFTGMFAADWDLPLPEDWGTATLSGSLYHSNRFLTTPNATIVSPSYNLLNLSLSYTLPDEHWNVLLYGTNINNAQYYVTGGEQNLSRQIMFGEPAMYGVTLTYHLGG